MGSSSDDEGKRYGGSGCEIGQEKKHESADPSGKKGSESDTDESSISDTSSEEESNNRNSDEEWEDYFGYNDESEGENEFNTRRDPFKNAIDDDDDVALDVLLTEIREAFPEDYVEDTVADTYFVTGIPPILYACSHGSIKCVQTLLKHGAFTGVGKGYPSPLHMAVANNQVDIVEVLLEHARDEGQLSQRLDGFYDMFGYVGTPLDYANQKRNSYIAKMLVDAANYAADAAKVAANDAAKVAANDANSTIKPKLDS